VLIGGVTVLAEAAVPASGFTDYSFDFVATGASTSIEFQVENYPAFFAIDDVSVDQVPEPGSLALVGAALFGAAAARRRKQV